MLFYAVMPIDFNIFYAGAFRNYLFYKSPNTLFLPTTATNSLR